MTVLLSSMLSCSFSLSCLAYRIAFSFHFLIVWLCVCSETDLDVGDIVCVHYSHATRESIRDMVTRASVSELRHVHMSSISLSAMLVWQVTGEVDPWQYYTWPSYTDVLYLSTSSNLSRQLPGEREAEHYSVTGVVEQLHIPAGGIIQLSPESAAQLGLVSGVGSSYNRVYFHRSRLHINGGKIMSDQRLDKELVPGDKVEMDIVRNPAEPC